VETLEELSSTAEEFGYPCVLKTRRMDTTERARQCAGGRMISPEHGKT
jgi:hypothetical protein